LEKGLIYQHSFYTVHFYNTFQGFFWYSGDVGENEWLHLARKKIMAKYSCWHDSIYHAD